MKVLIACNEAMLNKIMTIAGNVAVELVEVFIKTPTSELPDVTSEEGKDLLDNVTEAALILKEIENIRKQIEINKTLADS